MPSSDRHSPIAVVGVSALFPGSSDAAGFWQDILEGTDLLSDVPASHWLTEDYYDPDPSAPDKTYARRGGFLAPVDFDALGWGVPPSILPATDTSQLLALILAQRVLEDASNGQFEAMDRSSISVILGVTSAQELLATMVSRLQRPVWVKALREHGLPESDVEEVCQRIADHYPPWQESTFPGLLGNVVAGRIANRLNLGGTNCVTDAACASTFSALSMAVGELQLGHSDLVITGGVDTLNDIFMYMCFSKTPALSATGDCRPFSDGADGTMLGEGIGMVALKRLEDAERDGDRVYAVIRGVGTSSDGRSKSVYAPVSEGQARALRKAYDQAGFAPETVELVEAHGTGTKAGDVAEFRGLCQVFESESGRRQWCSLGSVKSQIGHTKAAAGAAGLFKAVMALHHKVLPPTIKVDRPNPGLEIEATPFHLNTEARPWIRGSAHSRRAGVSAFGFGGSNFHVVLEEYRGPAPLAHRRRALPVELVVLGAEDGRSLARAARELAARCDVPGTLRFAAWRGTQEGPAAARLALVARDEGDLRTKLERAANRLDEAPDRPFELPDGTVVGLTPAVGGVAFLFPGQGSQRIGMGADVAMHWDAARGPWDRAADLPFDERGLSEVVYPIPRFSPEERAADAALLEKTEWAQPAIGCASLSLLALLRDLGLEPAAVAGHSFGEVVALHAAGVFDEETTLRIARRRGELMAEAASHPGSMAAIRASLEDVEAVVAEVGPSVVVANHNAPDQVVVSGEDAAVGRALEIFEARGIEGRRLPVSTAFHSPVIADSCAPYRSFLDGFEPKPPRFPVFSGESATPYSAEADSVRDRLSRQIAAPVRFQEVVEALADAGISTFVEVGPGRVLTGLVDRILRGREHRAVALDGRGASGVEGLFRGLAQLVAAGIPLRTEALWDGYAAPADPSNRNEPKLAVSISGSNVGKPYPPPGGAADLPAPNPPRADEVPEVRESRPPAPSAPVVAAAPEPRPTAVDAPAAVSRVSGDAVGAAIPGPPISEAPPSDLGAAPVDPAWLTAWTEAQVETARAHAAFQEAMSRSHEAFLEASHAGIDGLVDLVAGRPARDGATAPRGRLVSPASSEASLARTRDLPTPRVSRPPASTSAPTPAASSAPASPVPEPAAAATTAPSFDLRATMLEAVAEKTGYPPEMIELGMDLEGDLGIDSIKRVEILAAVEERAPDMPEVDDSHMGTLRTVQQIVEYLEGLLAGPAPAVAAPSPGGPATVPAAAPTPAAPAVDLRATMLDAVAEKTGYPPEMIEPEMDLEGDLGIDSIKRVEILAAVEERVPGMPEVDASHMGTLRTVQQIVEYLEGLVGEPAPAAVAPSVAGPVVETAAAPTPAAPAVDLRAVMLEAVAEKTGYPPEMIEPEMDLEGDLGIDSIKRVEILAAVEERTPGMPEVDASHMGTLRTVRQIVEYLEGLVAGAGPAVAVPPPATAPAVDPAPAPTPVAPAVDLRATMLDAVAEKTGYPPEMIEPEMDLEGDLGIDSIKRVEILAAVEERTPGMPEVDASHMGTLRTVRQIVEYLEALMGGGSSAAEGGLAPTADVAAPDVAASPSPLGAPEPNPELGRWALELVDAPPAGFARPGLLDGPVAIVGGGTLGPVLADALNRRGVDARATETLPEDARAVVCLHGVLPVADVDEALGAVRRTFALARECAPRLTRDGGLFVTVQDTGGDFGTRSPDPVRAWIGGIPGLVKTARQEWPRATVAALDVATADRTPAEIAERLADELLAGGAEVEVALGADGGRRTLRSVAREITPQEPLLRTGDVVVVSGGARGVTAACVAAWAHGSEATFVLLGRSQLEDEPAICRGVEGDAPLKKVLLDEALARGEKPSPRDLGRKVRAVEVGREIRATLAAVEGAGARALYLPVDVADRPSLDRALDRVRAEHGPIRAVVHAAGVLADRRIAEQSDEELDRVFGPKIEGLRALLDATADDPLRLLAVFSSVSARCGNNGQAAYAMANEILNKVAVAEASRRGGSTLVKSFGWGPWEGGMVSPELARHFADLGVPMIPLAEGARRFVDEIRGAAPADVEIVVGGEPRPEALLSVGADERRIGAEVVLDASRPGRLAGHAIDGRIVVPVALVVDWLTHLAAAFRPDLRPRVVRDLRVLRGLRFPETGLSRIRLEARADDSTDGATLLLEARDPEGHPAYRARVEMRRPDVEDPVLAETAVPDPEITAWNGRPIYGDVLFHEGDFRLIESLEGVGRTGVAGVVRGVDAAGWPDGWRVDVAALDAGLQLLLLWAGEELGGASLPMGFDELRLSSGGLPRGPLRCVATCRPAGSSRGVADVVFLDGNGARVASLRGVELVLRPRPVAV